MDDLDRWTRHSGMTDPAGHAAAIADLPSEVGRLGEIVRGVLVHADWLADHNLEEVGLEAALRTTRPVADRLDQILGTDAAGLEIRRPSNRRAIGTCRDFALLLCSFLRCHGTPSRLRCGFAAYLGDGWEDNWVCEYWDRRTRAWRLGDPRIDRMLRDRYGIEFDPMDVPRHRFVTAGRAWSACRAGQSNPDCFGHGDATGLWFVKVNVVRDHYALNGRETSAWDDLRSAQPSRRAVRDGEAAWVDALASRPDQRIVEVAPDWPA